MLKLSFEVHSQLIHLSKNVLERFVFRYCLIIFRKVTSQYVSDKMSEVRCEDAIPSLFSGLFICKLSVMCS